MTFSQSPKPVDTRMDCDCDVRAIAAIMQATVPTHKLVGVAEALARIAPLLWGHHRSREFRTLQLVSPPTEE